MPNLSKINHSDELELINATSLQALPKLVSNFSNNNSNTNITYINKSVSTNTKNNMTNIDHRIVSIGNDNDNDGDDDDELHLLELIEND